MVDFKKLKKNKKKHSPIEPAEIFRRLPKPAGFNDLYSSQNEVLNAWFKRRNDPDVVLKLHTGGGKTLVGLLIAQSTLNEKRGPVLYLAPTVQLVRQTIDKANSHGISAVAYESGQPFHEGFVNGNAVLIATYKALFNGISKFGLREKSHPIQVTAVVLDDAHAAFSAVRDSFTLEVKSEDDRDLYEELSMLFRQSFIDTDRVGTFDDITSGSDNTILEVPYWAWMDKISVVRKQLKDKSENYRFEWPLLRDSLRLCHALISKSSFTITPILPIVNFFPTFAEAPRRIYMSATISDDSEVLRTFNATRRSLTSSLSSRSLAGVSERMVLLPDLMPIDSDLGYVISKLTEHAQKSKHGSVILVPSNVAAQKWNKIGVFARGSAQVEASVKKLQDGDFQNTMIFSNRYDGIDLPGNSCRLLILLELPTGTSSYDQYRGNVLYGSATIIRMLAQRIEQGIGRGARGAGDHCVVILAGRNISGWVSKEVNYRFLTSSTKAQLEMGKEISKEVDTIEELLAIIDKSSSRDSDWIEYHAETLAELTDEDASQTGGLSIAATERKAFDLWSDGYHEKALQKIEKLLNSKNEDVDKQISGWLKQLMARIAYDWGDKERANTLLQDAYSDNRNLTRPLARPAYSQLPLVGPQGKAIVDRIIAFRYRTGYIQEFDEVVSFLNPDASSNQFEEALKTFGEMIGLTAERHDNGGDGPDILWLLPGNEGFVIEAKSRKQKKKPLTRADHGQLLVAEQWFKQNYPNHKCLRVSVHPNKNATKKANAGNSYALTYVALEKLVADAKQLIEQLCHCKRSREELVLECEKLLEQSNIQAGRLENAYLTKFIDY